MKNEHTMWSRFVFWLLRCFIPPEDRDNLISDFENMYLNLLNEKSVRYANFWILGQVFSSAPGFLLAGWYWRYSMFKNYLKTTCRNMARNKLYFLINISGLAVGFVCFIIISLYNAHELSYDKYHGNFDNIYRVIKKSNLDGGVVRNSANCPGELAFTLKTEFPNAVKQVVRIWHYWGLGFNVQYKQNIFKEVNFALVDSTIFDIFDFEFLVGNPKKALSAPYSVVITESAAEKYFGEDNPLGKSLRVNDGYDVFGTGVVEDLPTESHFHFNFLASFSTLYQMPWRRDLYNWRDDFCYTYLLLEKNSNPEALTEKLPEYLKKYLPRDLQQKNSFLLQPLADIHLKSDLEDEIEIYGKTGNLQIYILFSIGFFILIIAIINYINMTTAYYSVRIKEIGVRKVLGSQRKQLMFQFLGESMFVCFSALILAVIFVAVFLPAFNNLLGKQLSLFAIQPLRLLTLLIISGLIVSLIAGAYPAFYISGFSPVQVLGSVLKSDVKKGVGRKILVVSQMAIATLMIFGSIIIFRQLNYVSSYDIKMDKDNIVMLSVNSTPIAHDHYEAFLSSLCQSPAVFSGTGLRTVVGFEHITEPFALNGITEKQQMIPFQLVRFNFIETFGVNILAGRNFSREFPTDETESILINQTMANQFGWDNQQAIGQIFSHPGWGKLKVIGVINDFNFESLHASIKPLVIKLIWPWRQAALTDYIAVRISPREVQNTLQFVNKTWKEFAPNSAFEYYFLNKKLNQFYRNETTLSRASLMFTLLAIVLACVGLLGLISFMTERKAKEIALRKVLGASAGKMTALLSREFIQLIVIANLIAYPIAFWAVKFWLQNFAYQIQISFWLFVLATLLTFLVTFLTIIFQTQKAASANPVKFLRNE